MKRRYIIFFFFVNIDKKILTIDNKKKKKLFKGNTISMISILLCWMLIKTYIVRIICIDAFEERIDDCIFDNGEIF